MISRLGSGIEFDRIRAIFERLGGRGGALGDDCALVTIGGTALALSTDLAVEGTHFRRTWLTAEEIGWRAAAAALSDLAAVAARPAGLLASVGVPADAAADLVVRIMEGVGAAAESVGASVWGGDLVAAPRIVIDVAVVGVAPAPVRRSGAVAGDELWVTGRLGAGRAAVRAWEAGREPAQALRARFAHPEPRVAAAAWLREHGAHAMIDLSDGLLGDAGHVAAASDVACVIDAERVPVYEGATADDALAGGEDYELLVALPAEPDRARLTSSFREAFGIPLTRVGRVTAGAGVALERGGKRVPLIEGYTHFRA